MSGHPSLLKSPTQAPARVHSLKPGMPGGYGPWVAVMPAAVVTSVNWTSATAAVDRTPTAHATEIHSNSIVLRYPIEPPNRRLSARPRYAAPHPKGGQGRPRAAARVDRSMPEGNPCFNFAGEES